MYHLFCFDNYYPDGGMNDYLGSFDTIIDAKRIAEDMGYGDNFEIVTQENGDYINPAKLVVIEVGSGRRKEKSEWVIDWQRKDND